MVKKENNQNRMMLIAGFVILLFILLFLLLPFIPLIVWSFTKQWPWPFLFPEEYSMDAWRYIFSPSGRGIEGVFNSVVIAFFTLSINLLLGLPVARTFAHQHFFGKTGLFIFFLSPLFIPSIASMIGMYNLSIQLDFINVYIRVTIAHVLITIPYFIATVWYQYRLMGTDILEAGKSLGAKGWQIFLWIELPQLLPALSLASVFVFIISLSQYLPTWIMSGGTLLTLPVIMFPFASSGNASIVAAYSLLFFVPVICMVLTHFYLIKMSRERNALD
ncbi:ABC transporter permease [Calidifontibacillus oryziterrae]|uniref:ABC transporter permease n=1 Tax=Calidifontibacillus oryziterrae TaxID=1191699 RepID=UPI0002E442AE|nr:ABC transporter permease subunit [Calidifontibacillus oryziterrae]